MLRELSSIDDAVADEPPFEVELIAGSRGTTPTASGLTLPVERSIDDPEKTDIAIVRALLVRDGSGNGAATPTSSHG